MSSYYRTRYEQAINIISTRIKLLLLQIPEANTDNIQEIRLRINKPIVIVTDKGSFFLTDKGKITKVFDNDCITVSSQEISDTLNRACNYSIHSFQQSINNGFITVSGGHRIGLAGTCIEFDDGNYNVKDIGFLNLRIARQISGISEKTCQLLFKNAPNNLIVAGPPSSGKTTFLRDFAYRISSGYIGDYTKTVVLDERGELSAPYSGVLQNDLGLNTDVMINYKKCHAVEIALRSLSPEYIIFDEICTENDLKAVINGLNSGVKFAVSIHCGNENDLRNKKLLSKLLLTNEFPFVVLLSNTPKPCTVKKIFKTEVIKNETIWTDINSSMLNSFGVYDSNANEKQNHLSEENLNVN